MYMPTPRCSLHFISTDAEFIDAVAESFDGVAGVTWETGDVRHVDRAGRIFVSPANSFGYMNGGIDRVYNEEMFRGCEAIVQRKIRELRPEAAGRGERAGLRVGSALWFLVDEEARDRLTALLVAPTMTIPCNVADTQNAYAALMATLILSERIYSVAEGHLHTLVCPALCCGIGGMEPAEAARQIAEAWADFCAGRAPDDAENHGITYALMPPVRGADAAPVSHRRRILPGAFI